MPRTRTSSCPGRASSAGLPARCSLCSRAASSPPGRRRVWAASCSYSTHRLPSASSEAGGPVGARVWGPPLRRGQVRSPQLSALVIRPSLPPASGSSSPGQPCHPATHTCGSPPEAGDMHIQTLGFPGQKETGRRGHRDSSFALARARGSSQQGWHWHLDSHTVVGVHPAPPWGGRRGTAIWALALTVS